MTQPPPPELPPVRSGRRIGPALALGAILAVALLGFAAPLLSLENPEALARRMSHWDDSVWSPLAGVLAFAVLASLGAPQFVLIGALVLVFGAWEGFAYSWIGKMISCSAGFAAGRVFGAGLVVQYASPALMRFMAGLARRGFWVSAGVRLTPTVPSVLVNIAAGATPIGYWPFIAGAGVGSVPKMALMAFGGAAAIEAVRTRSAQAWVALAAAVGLSLILWLVVRRRGRAG